MRLLILITFLSFNLSAKDCISDSGFASLLSSSYLIHQKKHSGELSHITGSLLKKLPYEGDYCKPNPTSSFDETLYLSFLNFSSSKQKFCHFRRNAESSLKNRCAFISSQIISNQCRLRVAQSARITQGIVKTAKNIDEYVNNIFNLRNFPAESRIDKYEEKNWDKLIRKYPNMTKFLQSLDIKQKPWQNYKKLKPLFRAVIQYSRPSSFALLRDQTKIKRDYFFKMEEEIKQDFAKMNSRDQKKIKQFFKFVLKYVAEFKKIPSAKRYDNALFLGFRELIINFQANYIKDFENCLKQYPSSYSKEKSILSDIKKNVNYLQTEFPNKDERHYYDGFTSDSEYYSLKQINKTEPFPELKKILEMDAGLFGKLLNKNNSCLLGDLKSLGLGIKNKRIRDKLFFAGCSMTDEKSFTLAKKIIQRDNHNLLVELSMKKELDGTRQEIERKMVKKSVERLLSLNPEKITNVGLNCFVPPTGAVQKKKTVVRSISRLEKFVNEEMSDIFMGATMNGHDLYSSYVKCEGIRRVYLEYIEESKNLPSTHKQKWLSLFGCVVKEELFYHKFSARMLSKIPAKFFSAFKRKKLCKKKSGLILKFGVTREMKEVGDIEVSPAYIGLGFDEIKLKKSNSKNLATLYSTLLQNQHEVRSQCLNLVPRGISDSKNECSNQTIYPEEFEQMNFNYSRKHKLKVGKK
jgi:CO dehydrogenase/acetyl-CoA synthase epsilon subunit